MKHLNHLGLASILVCLFFWSTSSQASFQERPSFYSYGEINGSITLNGCSASDVRLLLRAQPLIQVRQRHDFNFSDQRLRGHWFRHDQRSRVIRAEQTGEHSFTFRINGLRDGDAYRIGIKPIPALGPDAPPNPCGDLVWEGLPSSIALAGQPSVEITGTAVKGSLRVFNAPYENLSDRWPRHWTRAWARAGAIDFSDPLGATPQIRWSPPADVTRGIMQISLERFDRNLNRANCAAPEGMVYQGDVDIALLEEQSDGSYLLPAVDLHQVIVPPAGDGTIIGEYPDDVLAEDLPPLQTATVSAAEFQKMLMGKPLYTRVVPVTENTPACNLVESGIPPWVIMVLIDALGIDDNPPVIDEVSIDPAAEYVGPVVYHWPNYDHICMRSIKPHTLKINSPFDVAASIWTNTSINGTFPANKRFCWKFSNDGGGFDLIGSLGEIAGGLLSPFEWLVNGLSGLWADVKKFVVNAVADGLDALKIIDCNASCKAVLTAGLEIGLVAAGLPPSLPNFDQLKQQGLDYVASQVASQTGLPNSITEYAVNNGYKELTSTFTTQISNKRGSGIPTLGWAVFDNGLEPAILSLRLYRTATSVLPNSLYISGNAVYSSSVVPIPRVFVDANGQPEASHLDLNLVLPPDLSGWQQPAPVVFKWLGIQQQIDPTAHQIAVSQKAFWKARILQNPCVPYSVNQNYYLPVVGWVHHGEVANFPGAPVLMNTTLPPLRQYMVQGLQYCQP